MNKIQRIVFTMAGLLTVTAGYAHKIMAFYSENGTVTATVNSASITVGTDDIAVNSTVTLTGKAFDSDSGLIAFAFTTNGSLPNDSSEWTYITNTTSEITKSKVHNFFSSSM